MRRALSILLLLFASSIQAESPKVRVTLEMPVRTVLPGVPFDLFVKYENLTHRPIAVGDFAWVTITPDGGVAWRTPKMISLGREANGTMNVELEPGATVTLPIDWQSNLFAHDAAVTGPGAYTLRLDLAGSSDQAADAAVEYVDAAGIEPIRYTRIEPHGADAEVWKLIEHSRWKSSTAVAASDVADRIVSDYPDSAYVPYMIVLTSPPWRHPLDVAARAVQRFRTSPVYGSLLQASSLIADYAAMQAEQRNAPFVEVERLRQLAVTWTEEALRNQHPALREGLEMNLGVMKDRLAALRKRHSRMQ